MAPFVPTRRDLMKQRRVARERFMKARRVEREFQSQLTAVGRQIGAIIKSFAPEGVLPVEHREALRIALSTYSGLLRPWATSVTHRMQQQVNRKDVTAWEQLARAMGGTLRSRVAGVPVIRLLREEQERVVELITSLPLRAAERVHEMTIQGLFQGKRAKEISEKIFQGGKVTINQAKLIARTEVARTASLLTQVRAEHVGSEGYIWRTSDDPDVRPRHKRLEGKFIRWDEPPISGENGERAHAGQIYNCRCWPEPVVPDLDQVVGDVGIGVHPHLFAIEYPLTF